MSLKCTVQQGDHLFKIAEAAGFSDYHEIWDHPDNSDLKKLRGSPHVLLPGDELLIPDRELRTEICPTNARHTFQAKKNTLELRIINMDYDFEPLANTPCRLQLEMDSSALTTDPNGLIVKKIRAGDQSGTLRISGATIPLKIGYLDPVTEITGQQARLDNLGYNAGTVGQYREDQFRSAVEEFQCDQKLQVDGICGPKTQARLKAVHGC